MKLLNFLVVFLCLIFLSNPLFSQGIKFEKITWQGKTVDAASDFINVKLKSNFTESNLTTFLAGKALSIETSPDFQKIARIRIDRKTRSLMDFITELQASGMFEFVEPDFIIKASLTPNDTYYSSQYALPKVNAPGAWDITTGSESIIIGILDSGIPLLNGNLSHPDLQNSTRIIEGVDFIGDGNGVKDENGHGTHVAGIAGAETNNNTGVAGINWDSRLRINQVFDINGQGFHSDFRDGLIDAVLLFSHRDHRGHRGRFGGIPTTSWRAFRALYPCICDLIRNFFMSLCSLWPLWQNARIVTMRLITAAR